MARARYKISELVQRLQRWRHSRYQRVFEWQFVPAFWKWQNFVRRLQLNVGNRRFALQERWRGLHESFSISRLFVSLITQQTLLALAIVGASLALQIALSFLDFSLTDHVPRELRWLLPPLDDFSPTASNAPLPGLDPAAYDAILYTLVAVASTLLGLYFTAISVVASNAYAQVPSEVRQLLAEEKIGNRYIRAVALLAATALLLLAAHALRYPPGVVPLFIVIALALFALLGFAQLALRTLNFFDVTALLNHLTPEIKRWVHAATPHGFAWQNSDFQAAYQKRAAANLKTYAQLVDLAISRPDLKGERLAQLGSHALSLLQFYVAVKSDIPIESFWFERVSKRRDWLISGSTNVTAALACDTPLNPETMSDPIWFEKRITEIIVRVMRQLLEKEDYLAAAGLASQIQQKLWTMGAHMAVEEALTLHRAVSALTLSKIQGDSVKVNASLSSAPDRQRNISLLLAVVDSLGLGLINIQLGLIHQLPAQTEVAFESAIRKIDWQQSGSLYKVALPVPAKRELENLQQALIFELAVEGRVITPHWYQKQTAAHGLAQALIDRYTQLADEWEGSFVESVKSLHKNKQHIFAAQVVERGLEACHKFCAHLKSVEDCFDEMTKMRRDTSGEWPQADWEALSERVQAMRRRLIQIFAKIAAPLATISTIPDTPDYFGHAYVVLAQECADAVRSDEEYFNDLFPTFFQAAWLARNRVLTDYKDKAHSSFLMVHSLEPLMDLMMISGLALIYSELDGKSCWKNVHEVWESSIADSSEPHTLLNLLNFAGEQTIHPRIALHMNWEQQLENTLRDRGLKERTFNPISGEMTPGLDHSSPLIRNIADFGFGMLSHSPEQLFAAFYLMKRPEAAGVQWSYRTKEMAESLERSAVRHAKSQIAKSEDSRAEDKLETKQVHPHPTPYRGYSSESTPLKKFLRTLLTAFFSLLLSRKENANRFRRKKKR